MDCLAFPIKFDSTGLKKLKDGSTEYYAQLLSSSILTEPLVLPFSPTFGVSDPTFSDIDKGLFILNSAKFVPEVRIIDLYVEDGDADTGESRIAFSFEIVEL
jgi:hypothetical protein